MKRIFQTIGIFVASIAIIACGGEEQSKENHQEIATFPVFKVPVKTLVGYNTYPCRIEGIVNSQVRAKVSGYITEVLVDEGEKVKKGQLLFKLETQTLSQDAKAAQANVNAAQIEYDKLKPLVEKDIISSVSLQTAKAKLEQAKSSYSGIQANIGYANIKSPINGYVGSIRYRTGSLISSSDPNPLTTIAEISEVYAYFSMNEDEYFNFIQTAEGTNKKEKIKNMPAVQLVLANDSLYKEEGKIEAINSQVDPTAGTITFRATFPNPNLILSNGNSGVIKVPKTYKDAVVIPQRVTYEQQGEHFVYKVSRDSIVKAVVKKVTIEASVNNLYVIAAGVKEGDELVAKGILKLQDNTPIQPKEIPFDSIAEPINKIFR